MFISYLKIWNHTHALLFYWRQASETREKVCLLSRFGLLSVTCSNFGSSIHKHKHLGKIINFENFYKRMILCNVLKFTTRNIKQNGICISHLIQLWPYIIKSLPSPQSESEKSWTGIGEESLSCYGWTNHFIPADKKTLGFFLTWKTFPTSLVSAFQFVSCIFCKLMGFFGMILFMVFMSILGIFYCWFYCVFLFCFVLFCYFFFGGGCCLFASGIFFLL